MRAQAQGRSSIANSDGSAIRGSVFGRVRSATRASSSGSDGSSAPSHRHARFAVGLLAAALALLAIAPAASAVTTRAKVATFGTDGTSATTINNSPNQLTFNQLAKRLFVLNTAPTADRKIFGFDVSVANTYTPLAGNFPLVVGASGGEPDIASDNTIAPSPTAGNLYYESESTQNVVGFDSTGLALGAPFPIAPSSPRDLTGLAVDPSGFIWIGDWSSRRVRKYDPATGTELAPVNTSTIPSAGGRPAHPAFDSNGDMFLAMYQGALFKLTAASGYDPALATQIDSTTTLAIAVDRQAGTVYAVHSDKVFAYRTSDGALLYEFASIPGASFRGIAVNEATNTVYVSDTGNDKVHVFGAAQNYADATARATAATNVTDTSADINATVTDNNALPTSWRLEISADGNAWSTVSSGRTAGNEVNTVVSGTATGLDPNSNYRFRIVTNKGFGAADVATFALFFDTDAVAPIVSRVDAMHIGDTSARLIGDINPQNSATGYVFEYGTTPALGSSTAPVDIGGGTRTQIVASVAGGLSPDTTYYFRLVATNASGSTASPQSTFHTRAEPLPAPTVRGYEQVSPPFKDFGNAFQVGGGSAVIAVAQDGKGVGYCTNTSFGDPPSSNFDRACFSSRRFADGWRTQALTPAYCGFGNALSNPDQFLSANLDFAALHQPEDETGCPLLPTLVDGAPSPAKNVYREDLFAESALTYDLLVPDAGFVTDTRNPTGFFRAASDDFSHVIFDSDGRQTADAPPAVRGVKQVYEWDNGTLRLVSKDVNGNAFTTRSGMNTTNTNTQNSLDGANAVSADGSRIFFQNPHPASGRNCLAAVQCDLYMREDAATTHRVSQSECSASCGPSSGTNFIRATVDGSRVLFRSNERLTDAPTPGGAKLYLYTHSDDPALDPDPNLTLVSVDGEPSDGASANVQGILDISADAETVFFASTRQLVAGEPTDGAYKVYRWQWNDGDPTLDYLAAFGPGDGSVGVENDASNWQSGPSSEDPTPRIRHATPDGRYLIVQSDLALRPLIDRDGDRDVYRWSEEAGWECISCQVPGVPSNGPSEIDPATTYDPLNFELRNQFSDDGKRIFFASRDALLPEDRNGDRTDVYEWHDGTLSLATSGTAPTDAVLFGAGHDGEDLYFVTHERLSGWDTDSNVDVYDARLGATFPEPEPAQPPCEGEACRGAGSSDLAVPGAGSGVFEGRGNPRDRNTCGRFSKRAQRKARVAKRAARRGQAKRAGVLRKQTRNLRRRAKRCNRRQGR